MRNEHTVFDPVTRTTTAKNPYPGIIVSPNACALVPLEMVQIGSITGVVRDRANQPLPGVTVQAFEFITDRSRDRSLIRSATTGPDGSYTLTGLPSRKYLVGVNATVDKDESAYPPTMYLEGKRVLLPPGGTMKRIDMVLPPPRVPAQLRISVRGPNGKPQVGARVRLENLDGMQRCEDRISDRKGEAVLPAYVGDSYVIEAKQGARGLALMGRVKVEVNETEPLVILKLSGSPSPEIRYISQ
jgi:hypothetical protein